MPQYGFDLMAGNKGHTVAILRRLLDSLHKAPGNTSFNKRDIIPRLVLRAMMQARYIPGPADPAESLHFGLASNAYCHFTSPIRRYADLMVHRAIKKALGAPDKTAVPSGKKLLAACERCNECERTAQEADREITRRLACLLLEQRLGETFSCVISGVMPFGLFVEPKDFPVEGLIKIEKLPDDRYVYDEKRQMLLGSRTGRSWRLGQEISVQLEAVNLDRLEIDFLIAGGNGTAAFTHPPTGISRGRIKQQRSKLGGKHHAEHNEYEQNP